MPAVVRPASKRPDQVLLAKLPRVVGIWGGSVMDEILNGLLTEVMMWLELPDEHCDKRIALALMQRAWQMAHNYTLTDIPKDLQEKRAKFWADIAIEDAKGMSNGH
jgi:hypothetical protein